MSAPERIYLHWGESYPGSTDPDADDVTWCGDRVEPYDVEYVRADRIEALEAEAERLRVESDNYRQAMADAVKVSLDALALVPDPEALKRVCLLADEALKVAPDGPLGARAALEEHLTHVRATLPTPKEAQP